MRKSEKVKMATVDTLRTREDNIMDKQIIDISSKLRFVSSTNNSDMRLDQLESIYRNLGKALKIINAIEVNIFEERIK
jgi:hypothetical protein